MLSVKTPLVRRVHTQKLLRHLLRQDVTKVLAFLLLTQNHQTNRPTFTHPRKQRRTLTGCYLTPHTRPSEERYICHLILSHVSPRLSLRTRRLGKSMTLVSWLNRLLCHRLLTSILSASKTSLFLFFLISGISVHSPVLRENNPRFRVR